MSESKGYLVLETGETYEGLWHGGPVARAGEVVFNTSHSGYEEIATDPSYFKQIMVSTAPMMGNYGVSDECWESRQYWIHGFVCTQLQKSKRDFSWGARLIEFGIPVLSDLDTREIVLRLRDFGTPWGAIVKADSAEQALAIAKAAIAKEREGEKDWVYRSSVKSAYDLKGMRAKGPRVAVFDFGCKTNILRELQSRTSELRVFNSRTSAKEIRDWSPDGILLSNGPGDPMDTRGTVETVRELLGWRPVFGICMGHQILGLALGARTYKLKFGHRGSNHPVRDELLKKIYVTSQNHGYVVDEASLPSGSQITHTNLNDGTLEGFSFSEKNCWSVQYHPESHPGPHDAEGLFDYFVERLR